MNTWTAGNALKRWTLPLVEEYHNHLNMLGITEEDYVYAQRVWATFEMKNLGEYHDLYLKTDVLLLSNVF